MGLLYRLGIYFYGWAIRIAALFNEKAKLWVSGRKTVLKDIESAGFKDCLWMHCASLGEFEQGRPVLEELRRKHPNYPIFLTFFSPSGYEIRKN
ncbi:MAG: glycosyltransferase N-terminal domain-containing protein, partial [Cryomorphaceae bacterium]